MTCSLKPSPPILHTANPKPEPELWAWAPLKQHITVELHGDKDPDRSMGELWCEEAALRVARVASASTAMQHAVVQWHALMPQQYETP